ncbi:MULTISPECIES: toxin [Cellulosimicrobium]|uniref:toxin n=1 Tax=Cellulosimicrobium TaxID=157920 RepID=UPI00119E1B9D|nr:MULTISPECIES: toxin [Cellulosimicrobium]MBE9938210.1 toxin [Cellulosimicrobium cellulans]
MKLHESARKHYTRDRLTDDVVLYAVEHALLREPLDDEDDPRRWLLLGVDPAGRVLELVVLAFDSGDELTIHAMKARPQYLDWL